MGEKKTGAAGADMGMQARMSRKVIRRDGTVEHYPGEWHDADFETVKNLEATNPSFREWLASEWKKAKEKAEANAEQARKEK